jgi:two-component system, OmpR family, response regulator MprA
VAKTEPVDPTRLAATAGDIQLNMATHEVTRAGHVIDLTVTEYNLLHLFMSHVGQALDRHTILNQVWGYDFLGETNIIEVYVRYLREKIEDSPGSPPIFRPSVELATL